MTDTSNTPAASGQALPESKQKASHTPGHWEHDGNGLIYSDFVRDEGGTATLICDVADDLNAACSGVTPEQEANARLIAAAPTGLEAAEAVLDWWDVTPCRPQGDEPSGITQLRAFVAQAKGLAA